MPTLKIPTYYPPAEKNSGEEYAAPQVNLVLSEEAGLRVTMQKTADQAAASCPNVVFERRKNGWMLFLHVDDGDAVGYVQIHDDGRACLMRDKYTATELVCLEPGADGIDLD